MIHTVNGDRKLKYSTALIDYIKDNNLYNEENLIYTNKYTDGTFSITNPTSKYKNCSFINGYPHFKIPLDVCVEEIKNFINNRQMYNYNFNIRYGDTHPHKPIPKLAQIRNLLIENSLSSLIGSNTISYYALGDISIKSLNDFVKKYIPTANAEDLFIQIVNNRLDFNSKNKLLEYNKESLIKIKHFLSEIELSSKQFIVESSLYSNQNLYQKFKNSEIYRDELKTNGELKYSLQELMFIYSLIKNDNDILINIIGSNQSEHVLKVNSLLRDSDPNINLRFLTYGICRNAEERNVTEWTNYFEKFINDNNININGRKLNANELLKIIITVVNNDNILDFANLNKYLPNVRVFCNSISICNEKFKPDNISTNNDLICKMALVGYSLNRAIEKGDQNNFYKYILSIINEYELHKDKYQDIQNLYYKFINSAFNRLGFNQAVNNIDRNKVLIK